MVSSRVVATDLGVVEGPVWTSDGRLLVTSIGHGKIYEIGSGDPRVVAETGGGPNGMAEGADGANRIGEFGAGLRADVMEDGSTRRISCQFITRELSASNLFTPKYDHFGTLYLRNIEGELDWGVWARRCSLRRLSSMSPTLVTMGNGAMASTLS